MGMKSNKMTTLAFSCLFSRWHIFFHLFTLKLFMSLFYSVLLQATFNRVLQFYPVDLFLLIEFFRPSTMNIHWKDYCSKYLVT